MAQNSDRETTELVSGGLLQLETEQRKKRTEGLVADYQDQGYQIVPLGNYTFYATKSEQFRGCLFGFLLLLGVIPGLLYLLGSSVFKQATKEVVEIDEYGEVHKHEVGELDFREGGFNTIAEQLTDDDERKRLTDENRFQAYEYLCALGDVEDYNDIVLHLFATQEERDKWVSEGPANKSGQVGRRASVPVNVLGVCTAEYVRRVCDHRQPRVGGEEYADHADTIDRGGWLYVLSTEKQPNILKIGMTTRSVSQRVEEINSATGVVHPYSVRTVFRVKDAREAERRVFKALSDYRIRTDREFFEIPFAQVAEIITKELGSAGLL